VIFLDSCPALNLYRAEGARGRRRQPAHSKAEKEPLMKKKAKKDEKKAPKKGK
jgi:hypothetical protein